MTRSCTALAAKNSAALRASRADARRSRKSASTPGRAPRARRPPRRSLRSFHPRRGARRSPSRRSAPVAGTTAGAGRPPRGAVVADGWLRLLVPRARAAFGRLRPGRRAAAALRRVCRPPRTPPLCSPSLALRRRRRLGRGGIRRGEDAPAAAPRCDARLRARRARRLCALCGASAALADAAEPPRRRGARARGGLTPRARAIVPHADAREALRRSAAPSVRANGSAWRASLSLSPPRTLALAASATPAAALVIALCDAARSLSARRRVRAHPSRRPRYCAAAAVAPLVVAGRRRRARPGAGVDPRTAAPVRRRARRPSLGAIGAARRRGATRVVDALRVTAAGTAAAARGRPSQRPPRGEARRLWATFAAAIETKLMRRSERRDGVAASRSPTSIIDEGRRRRRTLVSDSAPDHAARARMDSQKHKEGGISLSRGRRSRRASPSDGDLPRRRCPRRSCRAPPPPARCNPRPQPARGLPGLRRSTGPRVARRHRSARLSATAADGGPAYGGAPLAADALPRRRWLRGRPAARAPPAARALRSLQLL